MPGYYKRKEKITSWIGMNKCGHGRSKLPSSPVAAFNCDACRRLMNAALYASHQAYGDRDHWKELVPVIRTVRGENVAPPRQKCNHPKVPSELMDLLIELGRWVRDDPSDPESIVEAGTDRFTEIVFRMCKERARK